MELFAAPGAPGCPPKKSKSSGGFSVGELPRAATFAAADSDQVRALAAADAGGWLETKDEDIRSLRSLVLYGLKGIAAYVEHAYALGKSSRKVFSFMLRSIGKLTDEMLGADALTALGRLCLLEYDVAGDRTVTRLPVPNQSQTEILNALAVSLPDQ